MHIAINLGEFDRAVGLIEEYGEDLIIAHYDGTTALHLAIMKHVKGNERLINAIMSKLSDRNKIEMLNAMTSSEYFHTDCTPLALAACMGHEDVIEILLGFGARFDDCDDVHKNNVLHSLVMFSTYDPDVCKRMYVFIKEKSRESDTCKNDGGIVSLLEIEEIHDLTPLQLSCRVGAAEMISCIIETEGYVKKREHIAPLSTLIDYDLKDLDLSYCKEPPSRLEYIDYNETPADIMKSHEEGTNQNTN